MLNVMSLEITEKDLNNPYYDDLAHALPCGLGMIHEWIRDMWNGKDFKFVANFNEKTRTAKGLSPASFSFYLSIWDKTKRWGVPNGEGWANEDWFTLELLSTMEQAADQIQHWHAQKKA